MLTASNISFTYGRSPVTRSQRPANHLRQGFGGREAGHYVLEDVSLEVARGSIVGLLGPNGSGKTTLLRIVAGILRPLSGRVLIGGQPIEQLTRRELARRIAVVPQETHSTFDFSVMDMVLMGRYPHLGAFELEGAADQEIAREAMAATGTAALETRAFATLSGGEKQRVIIASALAQASEMLLLDEPTAALDLGYQFEIAGLLRRLNTERRTTMVVSTHDLNLAAALCEHIVLLKGGRVVAHGATTDTLTAENIRWLYDVDADVQFHPRAGHLTVVPIARAN
jgi:ABC-type cobalamin/Fe3+-siderophores transport system ATPase subunit